MNTKTVSVKQHGRQWYSIQMFATRTSDLVQGIRYKSYIGNAVKAVAALHLNSLRSRGETLLQMM